MRERTEVKANWTNGLNPTPKIVGIISLYSHLPRLIFVSSQINARVIPTTATIK
ncbi:MAG: hypothetical protein ABIJ14_03485 [Nanoarchaeota archaeon]